MTVKSIGDNQHEIIKDIVSLYLPSGQFDLDPTYSKGVFYQCAGLAEPTYKSDIAPVDPSVRKSCASQLWFGDKELGSIMFDPPFLAKRTVEGKTALITDRFGSFPSISALYTWYDLCLKEFARVLKDKGLLVFKCQDTVEDHRQYLSHVWIINAAERHGFYCRDLFVLTAKSRMLRHNQRAQEHSRKFHSYFLVFEKKKSLVTHDPAFSGDVRKPLPASSVQSDEGAPSRGPSEEG